MSYWQQLGIEPGADRKTIKRAYAKLLKQNKPDENPAGFEALYSAYQLALKYAELQSSQASIPINDASMLESESQDNDEGVVVAIGGVDNTFDSDEVSIVIDSSEVDKFGIHEDDSIELTSAVISPPLEEAVDVLEVEHVDQFGSEDEMEAEYRQLLEKAERLLAMNSPVEIDDCRFIEKSELIFNLEYRKHLGYELFAMISNANIQSWKNKKLVVGVNVITYMDQLFGWEEQQNDYAAYFSADQLAIIFSHIAKKGQLATVSTTGKSTKKGSIKLVLIWLWVAFIIFKVILGITQ